MKKRILIIVAVVIVVMQFFRIDKSRPESDPAIDLIAMHSPSEEVESILRVSCYDCHSNETEYPWYSNVAPVSWLVGKHVREGRDELNFSDWGSFSLRKKDHKLEELVEEVMEDEMPLPIYLVTHGNARLDDEQKDVLVAWAKGVREELGYEGEK